MAVDAERDPESASHAALRAAGIQADRRVPRHRCSIRSARAWRAAKGCERRSPSTGSLRHRLQRQHEGVAVDDAGEGESRAGIASQRRLQARAASSRGVCRSSQAVASGEPLIAAVLWFLSGWSRTISLPNAVRKRVIPAIAIPGALADDATSAPSRAGRI